MLNPLAWPVPFVSLSRTARVIKVKVGPATRAVAKAGLRGELTTDKLREGVRLNVLVASFFLLFIHRLCFDKVGSVTYRITDFSRQVMAVRSSTEYMHVELKVPPN
jgi:hypothetical protein